ncbi:unnamed protein product [Prunus armeniaca]
MNEEKDAATVVEVRIRVLCGHPFWGGVELQGGVKPPNEAEFCFVGARVQSLPRVMISLQAKKLLQKGCVGFLANVFKSKKEESQMQDISVVRDYAYMFLDDIQGLLE